ncbi:7-carboxy-7-deazaguanine synthase QueE [Marinilabilia rubra]|uniref:7-carboxy-7-deazaguanine synthase n=1 Tax=Marinilabilia rubra TaxID=2162893 RepID=A0A2U2BCK1_9BACT|nr:7-carboxy-7-deazaguanine synthase QueE [Marinilabilia rubra]PWE00792.1 7-carboxy-7-deazaguanine synthase QueE [Marinilabilia rubra]
MSKLVLANEGVFPITKDQNGQALKDCPATGLSISGTIQGEGKLAGVPSLFIRLASCNLRCMWELPDGSLCRCDTPYASFEAEQDLQLDTEAVFNLVKNNIGDLKHVVLTGGEPMLQHKALSTLAGRLKEELRLHLSIETNGTIFAEDVAKYIDLFSISPKLSNSDPNPGKLDHYELKQSGPLNYHPQKRKNIAVLQKFIAYCKDNGKEMQLKFVVGKHDDHQEIKEEFIAPLNDLPPTDVMLMPLGATKEELALTSKMVLEMAIKNGWRYAPRLHIDLFGPKAGV